MGKKMQIHAPAMALFNRSANAAVNIGAAWRREDSSGDVPEDSGMDGWTSVHELATIQMLTRLKDQGFTYVALSNGAVVKHAWLKGLTV